MSNHVKYDGFLPQRHTVQVDLDASRLGRRTALDLAVHGDFETEPKGAEALMSTTRYYRRTAALTPAATLAQPRASQGRRRRR